MTISQETKKWLRDAGYKYYAFISYPNTKSKSLIRVVERLKEDVFDYPAQSIDDPELFLDRDNIKGGYKWEKSIAEDLCRSVALLAVITELYYDPAHKWCGWEWKNMSTLSNMRLPKENFQTLIPILIRKCDDLPSGIRKIQCYDFSGLITSTRYYYQTNDYYHMINEIGRRIQNIAKSLSQNNAQADCEDFKIVRKSAFLRKKIREQHEPRFKIV